MTIPLREALRALVSDHVQCPSALCRRPHRRGPRASDPADWDEPLERILGEVARRYLTALTSVQARRLYVVIDLGPLLSTPPTLLEPERRLLLERLDELVQIGRSAAVHVLAIATDPAANYRVSSRVRNTARVFRLQDNGAGARA